MSTDAQSALAARGFGTFKRWARENRKAASEFRTRHGSASERHRCKVLAECLDAEFDRLIRPNLNR